VTGLGRVGLSRSREQFYDLGPGRNAKLSLDGGEASVQTFHSPILRSIGVINNGTYGPTGGAAAERDLEPLGKFRAGKRKTRCLFLAVNHATCGDQVLPEPSSDQVD
jgi:hypothetical protein